MARPIDNFIPTKSNYLKKEDVGEQGKDLIIKDFKQEEVGNDNEQETKLVVYWTDPSFKPMVINRENGSRLKIALKTDDLDLMIGHAVCVYSDPFVAFGGKVVGGLRIRSSKQNKPNSLPGKPTAKSVHVEVEDDGPPSPPIESYEDESGSVPF